MKSAFVGLVLAFIGGCSSPNESRHELYAAGGEVDRSNFDSYCASYDSFPVAEGAEKGAAIQYAIRRIKFAAGIDAADLKGTKGCIGITRKLEEAIKIPFNAARGGVRYKFELGVRWNNQLQKYEVDPEENFSLEDLEAFTHLKFITDLHLPHGKIRDLTYLAAMSNLRVLDLRNNQIDRLGGSVRSFSRLEYLDLSFNRLKDFTGIGGNASLKFIDLRENCADSSPESLRPSTPEATFYAPSIDATIECK
jgi:Leucine-rich repeat (LRR) protein